MNQHKFEQKMKEYIERAGLSQAAVARKLEYRPDQFNKWIRGVNRIPDIVIQESASLLKLTEEERVELFRLAGYVAFETQKETTQTRPAVSVRISFSRSLKAWSEDFFRWSEASDHMRSSWTGIALHILSTLVERTTAQSWLTLGVAGLLSFFTIRLLTPIFRWPLDDPQIRWWAFLKFGLATLFIPLLIAFVTPLDRPGLFVLDTFRRKLIFWQLKLTGALVGFGVFAIISLVVAVAAYYCYIAPLHIVVRAILALPPLFFGYITARRIPADRHKMFEGELQIHEADRLFLIAFLLLGPGVTYSFYKYYDFIADRTIGPLLLLIPITAIALWQVRENKPEAFSDPSLIFVFGLLFPAAVLFYGLVATPGFPPPSPDEWPSIIIIGLYFLSWTVFAATLFVRKQVTLTLRGVLSVLGLLLIANVVTISNRWWGLSFIIVVFLIWELWGQRKLKTYFWVHHSFWIMIIMTGMGIGLLLNEIIPLWANGVVFFLVSIMLTSWAYRIPGSDNRWTQRMMIGDEKR